MILQAVFSESLEMVVEMARVTSVIARRFGLPGGLGFSDFAILYHLHRSPDGQMRRVDLAEKLGMTASGITRLVAPLEKLGIVKRVASDHDGRVVYVALAPGGKRLFSEALESAEENSRNLISPRDAAGLRKVLAMVRV
jgi:DNA-binding MarR family transcriptional regulator